MAFQQQLAGGCGLRGLLLGVLAGLARAEARLSLSGAVEGCGESLYPALRPDYTWGASWQRDVTIWQLEWKFLELERHLQSVLGEAGRAPGPLWPHPPPSVDGSWLPLLHPGEKEVGGKKHITCFLAEDGTPLMDLGEMQQRARAYYVSLFSLDLADACEVLWDGLLTVSMGDQD